MATYTKRQKRKKSMYKDIVIKKRVWMPEDDIDISNWEWCELFEDSSAQIESTTVDFNGRIPVEDGAMVGEWIINRFQLIKAEFGELLSEGEEIKTVTIETINKILNSFQSSSDCIVPIGIYSDRQSTAVQFSNGQYQVAINLKYFQYIYDTDFDYEVNSDVLVLKRDGLVCGYVMGMELRNADVIWQRPYSLADVEALTSIQGDQTLP